MLQNYNSKLITSLTLLFLLGLIWGSGYSIARFAVTHGVPPLGYSFWQALGPAIVLIFLSLFKKNKDTYCKRSYLPYFLICGLLGIAIPNSNMYFAAQHLPAGILAVLVNTVPIFTYFIALMLKQEKFKYLRFLAILIGCAGILLIIFPKHDLIDLDVNKWTLITLLTPISFALCSVYIAKFRPAQISSYNSSIGMLIVATLLLTPVVYTSHSFYALMPPFNLPKLIIILEIILSSIGYVIFFKLIKIAGPVYYSLTGGIVSVIGLIWGRLLFNEHLTSLNLIAILLILIAIATLSLQQKD